MLYELRTALMVERNRLTLGTRKRYLLSKGARLPVDVFGGPAPQKGTIKDTGSTDRERKKRVTFIDFIQCHEREAVRLLLVACFSLDEQFSIQTCVTCNYFLAPNFRPWSRSDSSSVNSCTTPARG